MLTCTSTSSEAISTASLKVHMRVEAGNTSEDTSIHNFGLAAQRYIEARCRMTVESSSWQKQTRAYIIPLEMGELDTLDAVVSVDDAGAETAITDYRLNSAPALATLVIGNTVEAAEFRVRWTASAPDDMVESITQAIAMTAAHFFAHRESVVKGTIAAPMPMGVDMLCDSLSLARL